MLSNEAILKSIELFSKLDRIDLAKLVPELEELHYTPGEILFHKGERGDSLIIITRGQVRVFTFDGEGREHDLATIGKYECLGEMALLTGAPRSASVQAQSEVAVLRLSRQRFERLLEEHHFLSIHINRILAQRLASSNEEAATGKRPEPAVPGPEAEAAPALDLPSPPSGLEKIGWRLKKALTPRSGLIAALLALFSLGLLYGLHRAGLTSEQVTLAMLLWLAAVGWSTNALSFNVIALALPIMAVILGVSDARLAFSGFSSTSWFLVLGVIAIAAAMSRTGLLFRAALWMTSKFSPNFANQSFALAITGVLLTPIIPSAKGRSALAGSLALDLIETFGLRDRSRGSVGVAMACMLGFGQMSFLFMNGTTACLLVFGLLPRETAATLSWGLWFKIALPLALFYFILSFVTVYFFYREKIVFDPQTIRSQLNILGPLTAPEIVSLGITALYLLGVLTQPWHHIDNALIAMLAFLLMIAATIIDEKSVRQDIDWNHLISFGALIGFGAIMQQSELFQMLASNAASLFLVMSGHHLLFLLMIATAVHLLRFALPLEPALIVSMLTLTPVGALIGINPFIIALVILISSNPLFLPYQNSIYNSLAQGGEDRMLYHSQIVKFAYAQVVVILLSIALSAPYWGRMGFM